MNIERNGKILIAKASDSDEGLYECTATNEYIVNGHIETHRVVLARVLRVKSKFSELQY